jgi:hypothetical protein
VKKVLEYVSDTTDHTLADPLKGVVLAALVGGTVLYLLAHVVFKWLTVHDLSVIRLAAAAIILLTAPLIGSVPAVGQLGFVAGVLTLTLVVESVVWAESRHQIRAELSHR